MKKLNRAVCGIVAVLGFLVAIAGLVLCMCETPEFADQLRNMAVGGGLIAFGSGMAYMGGAERWQEGPYARL